MTTIRERLIKQDDEDAKKCIRIFDALFELNQGHVWNDQWDLFTEIKKLREQEYFGDKYAWGYAPSKIGEIFLKGLDK